LNRYGFYVDLVDRNARDYQPSDEYAIFIGLGVGNSGRNFANFAERVPSATKVLLALSAEPSTERLIIEHYNRFNKRHQMNIEPMRPANKIDFQKFLLYTDYILAIGEESMYCHKSYMKLSKEVLSFLPGTSPNISFSPECISKRDKRKFICFTGNGFIAKGVDVITEAFLDLPDLHLYICGPDSEQGFFEVLGDRIYNSENIHYEGFIDVGGRRFNQLCSECAYAISASQKEGCSTSITSMLRAGLVPITTYETGVHIGDFGFQIDGQKSNLIERIKHISSNASSISDTEYRDRVFNAYLDSFKYTECNSSSTISKSITSILKNNNL